MLCKKCPNKKTCLSLCQEAEEYANQDEVIRREALVGLPKLIEFPDLVSNTPLTKREREILTLLGRGLSRRDVCNVLNITRENLRDIIRRLRKKTHDFDDI